LTVLCQQDDKAVRYHEPGLRSADRLALSSWVLQDVEGSAPTPVWFERLPSGQISVEWSIGEQSRSEHHEAIDPDLLPPFPDLPENVTVQESRLFSAFRQALAATTEEACRYLLRGLQLRSSGEVVGTDGRQLLVHSGFSFPWTEHLLLPDPSVFKAAELKRQSSAAIGSTGTHVVVEAGPWRLHLPIDAQSRYPRIEEALALGSPAISHCRLSNDDAAFLRDWLPHLPGKTGESHPITVDWDGQVMVHGCDPGESSGIQLLLTSSTSSGPPLRLVTDRRFLERALDLGFTEISASASHGPIRCQDSRRIYLWMPMTPTAALPPQPGDHCIRSEQPRR
jgi:hypothetical protein